MYSLAQEMKGYRIKAVAEMTGFTTHAIRKWEKRYNLLTPRRGENGYRVYSDQDLQLLMYVKAQLDSGKTIGQLATQGSLGLQKAISCDPVDVSEIPEPLRKRAVGVIQAARRMDHWQVEGILQQSWKELGPEGGRVQFFFPLLRTVGVLWHQGMLTISSELLISQTIRRLLAETTLTQKKRAMGPTAIVGCFPNDFHDIGAMTAAGILQQGGWKTVYIGPNMDIELIHLACVKRQSKLVVLACVVEQPPEKMKPIIGDITKFLLPISSVVVGGMGVNMYRDELEKHNIIIINDLLELKTLTPDRFGFTRELPATV